ncbi:MAG: response regulator [Ktedonobacterales bacterium]
MAKTFLGEAPDERFYPELDGLDDNRPDENDEPRGYTSPHSGPLGEVTHLRGMPPELCRPVTVLVVDDESSIAELIGEVLVGAGYRVLQAGNGRVALAIARREHPELVITDRMMPEIDGVEFVRRLYDHPTTRGIPVVIMSSTRPSECALDKAPSYTRALDRLATKKIPGVSTVVIGEIQVGFLEKPFDIDALVDLVDTITTEEGTVSPLSH